MTDQQVTNSVEVERHAYKSTLLYSIVRPIAALGLKIYFRKIYLSNTQHIPKDKPVILAANHPTAFLEPCILACFLDRPIHFLVRGDFFKKPFYAKLLRSLQMLPVFRLKDGGYKNLKNNYLTFQSCYDALQENKTLMILAEGRCIHEKRLRPIQKGTGRIATGALEQFPELEDVYIVPVGVNYTYADRFRSIVMIDFSEPMSARDYYEKHDMAEAINQITDNLRSNLEERIVIIDQPLDDKLAEQLLLVHRNERSISTYPIISDSDDFLEAEKSITNRLNALPEQEKEKLGVRGDAYFEGLQKYGISDAGLLAATQERNKWQPLFLVFGALPALLGYLTHLLPLLGANFAANLTRSIEFYAPVRWAAGTFMMLFWYIALGVGAIMVHHQAIYILLLVIPFLGYFALLYSEDWQSFESGWKARRVPGTVRAELLQLRDQFKSSFSSERSESDA